MNPKNDFVTLPVLGPRSRALALVVLLSACSGSSGGPAAPDYQIVASTGGALQAVAGDAIGLKVVVVAADGSMRDLATGMSVAWTSPDSVTTLPPDNSAPSPLPVAGNQPTAACSSFSTRAPCRTATFRCRPSSPA